MSAWKSVWVMVLLAGCSLSLSAQSSLRVRQIAVSADWTQLDTLPVWPASVLVFTPDTLPASAYEVQYNAIRFRTPANLPPLVRVQYRVLDLPFLQPLSRLDSLPADTAGSEAVVLEFPTDRPSLLPSQPGLDYRGAFSRGISFGNNQSLVLNSSLNLQLSGTIGDGIAINGAISDENIPIQPEGSTQQLNEFDRVFIQLKKGGQSLTLGDFELRRPEGYFQNYFKKLQGAQLETRFRIGENATLTTQANAAITRGKFARQLIAGQEGNQGPYRLEGAEGERFIIVLAGTEKIYIDGVLMQRGLEQDYVIDYNRGDITFTSRRLITKDIRIIAEFEYSDQNYLRSLMAVSTAYKSGDLTLYGNYYSEQDGRRSLAENGLSDQAIEVLRQAGDDPLEAVISGLDTAGVSTNPITYRLIDTLAGGVLYSGVLEFYQPVEGDTTPIFTARFSDVGLGNGNYIRQASNANGVVYAWVAPDPISGPQGQFEPVVQLVAPEQLQLLSAGAIFQPDSKTRLQAEWVGSRTDQNRFSDIDRGDDYGWGSILQASREFDTRSAWNLGTAGLYEFIHRDFRALNPYRPPEFARDWNLAAGQSAPEHFARAELGAANDSLGLRLDYHFSGFWREGIYQGLRHQPRLAFDRKGWKVDLTGDWLTTQGFGENTLFARPKVLAEKKLGTWKAGFYGEREKNSRQAVQSDTLSGLSFYYDMGRVYVESPQTEKYQVQLIGTQRWDYAPAGSDFTRLTTAWDIKTLGYWQPGSYSRLGWELQARRLTIDDTTRIALDPADTYLGRIDYGLTLYKGAIRYTASYQLGSGQEQKLQFLYRPVLTGAGLYQHIDFNGDGQEQTDEFILAPTPDQGTHERIVIFTNEFVRTNQVVFNQSLRLEPRAVWYGKKGWRKWGGKLSLLLSWQTDRKVQAQQGFSAWNPFAFGIADTALIAGRNLLQNTLFFNQGNPAYDIQAVWTDAQNKLLLTTGFETRRNLEQGLRLRINPVRAWSVQTSASTGLRLSLQEQFPDRNFEFRFQKLEGKLTWLPKPVFRLTAGYRREGAVNTTGLGERGRFDDLKIEGVWNQASTTSLRWSLSFVQVKFDGEASSPIGTAFLNGLQKGGNYIWNLSLDRQLTRNIRLSISYEGRKTGQANVVHVGRAQAAATF